MLVPSMTLDEIRKEINKDSPIVFRKMDYVTHDIIKKLSKNTKKEGYIHFFDYRSKCKNNWIFKIQVINKKAFNSAIILYHNGRGYVGIAVTDDQNIIYHTGHFFERYNERLNLGLTTLNEIIRSYMTDTDAFKVQELDEIEPGISKMFCTIKSGAILGIYNKKLKFIKANTFITNDMMYGSQIEMKAKLSRELDKYKNDPLLCF